MQTDRCGQLLYPCGRKSTTRTEKKSFCRRKGRAIFGKRAYFAAGADPAKDRRGGKSEEAHALLTARRYGKRKDRNLYPGGAASSGAGKKCDRSGSGNRLDRSDHRSVHRAFWKRESGGAPQQAQPWRTLRSVEESARRVRRRRTDRHRSTFGSICASGKHRADRDR